MSMSSTLTDGDLVARRYRLQRTLGAGATAVVWAAHDIDLGRPVAIKLLAEKGVDDELRRRFEREADVLGHIRHPNLVEVLASGHHEGRPFLVMELLEGRALDTLLDDAPLDPIEAAQVASGVAAGLGAVHEEGIVHRDVKPGNIVIDEAGRPRLVDFGIARSATLTDLTRTDVVMGTAAYLSPEQAQAKPLDARSDVYALGCVLHEMVAGSPPFDGASGVVVAYRHIKDEPPALRSLVPDVPPALEAIAFRCLAKDPGHRYPNGAAVAADLELFLQGAEPAAVADQRSTTAMPAAAPSSGDPTTVIAPVNATQVMPAAGSESDASGAHLGPAVAGAAGAVDGHPIAPASLPASDVRSDPSAAVRPHPGPPDPSRRDEQERFGAAPAAPALSRRLLVAAVATIVMALLVALVLAGGSSDSGATVPSVAGLSYDEAAAQLEDAGLRPARIDQEAGGAEPGTVIATRPEAGTELDDGSAVELIVATAPPPPPAPAPDRGDGDKDDGDKEDSDKEDGDGKGKNGKDDD